MGLKQVHFAIGTILREAREREGRTQSYVANKLGYDSPQFVSLFERGLSKIPLETLGRVCIILNLSPRNVLELLILDAKEEISGAIKRGINTQILENRKADKK